MAALDLRTIREELGLTQSAFATLLGYSIRTVQSCEQGWRHPSPALEKTALMLYFAREQGQNFGKLACWDVIKCPPQNRDECIAFRTGQGHLCWFLTGNLSCAQKPLHDWGEKKRICFRCSFFRTLLGQGAAPPVEEPAAEVGSKGGEPAWEGPEHSLPIHSQPARAE
jgi:DNA-binding XRE family transcriptional regulator